jgi:hypothetical protein
VVYNELFFFSIKYMSKHEVLRRRKKVFYLAGDFPSVPAAVRWLAQGQYCPYTVTGMQAGVSIICDEEGGEHTTLDKKKQRQIQFGECAANGMNSI